MEIEQHWSKTMPKDELRTTPHAGAKPRSFFSGFSVRDLYVLCEKPIKLFRVWYLVVYHPSEFFRYFFGPQSDFGVRSTILLGVLQVDIDAAQHKILGPRWFMVGTATISIPLLAVTFHFLTTFLPATGANIGSIAPPVTGIQVLDEFILAGILTLAILACTALWASYLYLICKKGTSYIRLFDLSAYTMSALFLVFYVGLPVLVLLFSLGWNMKPGNDQLQWGFVLFVWMFSFFLYVSVFLYLFGEILLRLLVANQIVVLRDVLHQPLRRIVLAFTIPIAVVLFMILSLRIN